MPNRPNNAAISKIIQTAKESAITKFSWKNRGLAPIGYVKGMAVVFAKICCKLKAGAPSALEMSKAALGDPTKDALAWYTAKFDQARMDNSKDGVDTLRHLFVLLMGLGMRESSGRYCEGRDRSASNTTSETAEAGLFQTSFNARTASPLLLQLYAEYFKKPNGDLDIFREGVKCSSTDLENFGEGDGREFQRLTKEVPAFAVEFAAVGLRNVRTHWGPINRRAAEVRLECDVMFKEIQKIVEDVDVCSDLL